MHHRRGSNHHCWETWFQVHLQVIVQQILIKHLNMASSPRVKSGRGDISMEFYPYYVNMASDYTSVSPVMPCIAATKAEKRE